MSSSFTVTRDQVITQALRKLGVIELGDTPDATTLTNAAFDLNLLVKHLNSGGLKLWKTSELIVPYQAGVTSYALGTATGITFYDVLNPHVPVTDKPLKVIQAWYRNTSVTPNIDTPVMLLSKQEYNVLGSKFSTGTSNSIFYDPRSTKGYLYVYLTPDTTTATNMEIHLVAQMPIQDPLTGEAAVDFPDEWYNCLVWNLADQLAVEYGVPMNLRQEIQQRALLYRQELEAFDVEQTSTFFQPDYRGAMSSGYSR